MKIEFFHTMNYWGPDHGDSWPAPPRICETELVSATIEHGLIECGAALDAGFDSLNFAEHHYSPKQLTPNPIIFAAVAGRQFPDAQIGVFGTDLPLNNPVRIAEEYSMLDNLLDGRLRIGMLRGTPNEYLTYGSNPWESRERYEEGILLLKACFTEPEPFGWEGRYYRFRNIAVWPRRVQDPHPRILISGNSKDGAIFAGQHGLDLGFSYMAAEKCAEHAALYRQAAAEAGWEPTADNLQYRHFMYVTNTDDEAHRDDEGAQRWRSDEHLQRCITRHDDDDGADRRGARRRAEARPDRSVDGAADGDGPGAVRQPRDRARPHQGHPRCSGHGSARGLARHRQPVATRCDAVEPEADRRRDRSGASQDGSWRHDRHTGSCSGRRRSSSKSVDAAGFTVRYLEAGDGPAVLYLPGAGGPVMTFALDALAERFRVIVIEYPGWGAQPNDVADFDGLADQVAEIATALGLERFHLMGRRSAARARCTSSLRHTEMVESLVLEAPGKIREQSVHPSTLAPGRVREGVQVASRAAAAHGPARSGVHGTRVADGRAIDGRRNRRRLHALDWPRCRLAR